MARWAINTRPRNRPLLAWVSCGVSKEEAMTPTDYFNIALAITGGIGLAGTCILVLVLIILSFRDL